jgi:beta-glucosidase
MKESFVIGSGQALPRIAEVESLLSRMTLTEKAGQMSQLPWPYRRSEPGPLADEVRAGRVGSLLNVPTLEHRNALQKIAVEGSRLGIPLLFGRDVIHGYRTVFPIPLGLSASFDPTLVEAAAAVAAREAAETGIDWTFAPMVDISRDPRWGRVAESPGEDPFLASVMGTAMVRGFQGEDPADRERVAACAKHYLGYGAAEAGKDYNTTSIPEQLLREVYLAPFKACVDAGVLTLMSAFSDLNGIPASGNEHTLRQILKQELGFTGFVVSDWGATREMLVHGFCADDRDVAEQAVRAGIDMEMATVTYLHELPGLVEQGSVPGELVDEAVRRVLGVKHRLGLFERPYVEPPVTSVALSEEHRALARQTVQESAVLLKNEGDLLPLRSELSSLAVIGPLADDGREQLGCWAHDGRREDSVTLLDALRERLGPRVRFARGLEHCRSTDRSGFEQAVELGRQSDAILAVVGESAVLSGEARCRAFLDLPGAQAELVERLASTGKPLIVVFMAGRPLTIGSTVARCRAALFAWHPGTMAGPGLVDLLFGDVAPSGKLPVSFPRTVGQVPIYYGHKNTGRPPKTDFKGIPIGTPMDPVGFESSYLDVEVSPEYPFGFGLSYTTFEYRDLEVSPPRARVGDSVTASVTVRNTGRVAGEEVVQLYLRDLVASVTRPVRELKGFLRIRLESGESKRVEFPLGPDALSFCGRDLAAVTEPGRFRLFVGGDSRASLGTEFELE